MNIKDQDTSQATLAHVTQEIIDTLDHAQTTAVDYVKKHPLQVMGMTLLAGIVVAQMLRLRK